MVCLYGSLHFFVAFPSYANIHTQKAFFLLSPLLPIQMNNLLGNIVGFSLMIISISHIHNVWRAKIGFTTCVVYGLYITTSQLNYQKKSPLDFIVMFEQFCYSKFSEMSIKHYYHVSHVTNIQGKHAKRCQSSLISCFLFNEQECQPKRINDNQLILA